MTASAMDSLWQYIQSLSMTEKNRRWLANKLIEPNANNTVFNKKTLAAIEEIDNGKATVCNTWDEFLEAVK